MSQQVSLACLPDDVYIHSLCFLNFKDIKAFELVSRRSQNLADIAIKHLADQYNCGRGFTDAAEFKRFIAEYIAPRVVEFKRVMLEDYVPQFVFSKPINWDAEEKFFNIAFENFGLVEVSSKDKFLLCALLCKLIYIKQTFSSNPSKFTRLSVICFLKISSFVHIKFLIDLLKDNGEQSVCRRVLPKLIGQQPDDKLLLELINEKDSVVMNGLYTLNDVLLGFINKGIHIAFVIDIIQSGSETLSFNSLLKKLAKRHDCCDFVLTFIKEHEPDSELFFYDTVFGILKELANNPQLTEDDLKYVLLRLINEAFKFSKACMRYGEFKSTCDFIFDFIKEKKVLSPDCLGAILIKLATYPIFSSFVVEFITKNDVDPQLEIINLVDILLVLSENSCNSFFIRKLVMLKDPRLTAVGLERLLPELVKKSSDYADFVIKSITRNEQPGMFFLELTDSCLGNVLLELVKHPSSRYVSFVEELIRKRDLRLNDTVFKILSDGLSVDHEEIYHRFILIREQVHEQGDVETKRKTCSVM